MSVIVNAGHWSPGKHRSLHEHRDPGLEVICVTGGVAWWQAEGERYQVPAGHLFATWPWERHGSVMQLEPGLELSFLAIRLQRAYRRKPRRIDWPAALGLPAGESARLSRRLSQLIARRRIARYNESLLWLMRHLIEEHHRGGLDADALTAAATRALLVHLVRCLDAAPAGRQPQPHADDRVAQLLARVAQRCEAPWSVDAMAGACGLKRSRFTDLVRAQTGDTPLMYVNRRRVANAMDLLRQTDRQVVDIALSCGFGSSQYFCRVFRDYAGMTPGAYRRQSRAASAGPAATG